MGQNPAMSADRQLGVDLFNETWRLMRSREDDARLVDCAHASAYHWSVAPECTPENRARSEWLLARVYTVVGRPEEALAHAGECLGLCERHEVGDWDLAFAHEALARASRLAGDEQGVALHVEHARAVEIADAEDRELLESDLATI
jgi:hypothetical protein